MRSACARWVGEVAHQGVVAEVEPLAPLARGCSCSQRLDAPHDPLLLALDGVQDPHNLGACLRTADACGVLAVIVPRDRAAPLNATARKVAAGAAETTPVVTVTNLARSLELLKDAGLWIVGADAAATQRAARGRSDRRPVLVMGAEGTGLRELTRRSCDWLVAPAEPGCGGEPERLGGHRHAAVRGAAPAPRRPISPQPSRVDAGPRGLAFRLPGDALRVSCRPSPCRTAICLERAALPIRSHT